MPSEAHDYKLTYFSLRGLGEPIRLLFHYKSIPFEDVRLTLRSAKWVALKPKTPYGTIPMLEWVDCDGDSCECKMLGQSQTIYRFLAKKYGLVGKTDWEAAKADELCEWLKDIWHEYNPFFMVAAGFQEGDKTMCGNSHCTECLANNSAHLLAICGMANNKLGSGFLVPSGITWADFSVVNLLTTFKNFDEANLLSQQKELMDYEHRVYSANESVKNYVEGRPKDKF